MADEEEKAVEEGQVGEPIDNEVVTDAPDQESPAEESGQAGEPADTDAPDQENPVGESDQAAEPAESEAMVDTPDPESLAGELGQAGEPADTEIVADAPAPDAPAGESDQAWQPSDNDMAAATQDPGIATEAETAPHAPDASQALADGIDNCSAAPEAQEPDTEGEAQLSVDNQVDSAIAEPTHGLIAAERGSDDTAADAPRLSGVNDVTSGDDTGEQPVPVSTAEEQDTLLPATASSAPLIMEPSDSASVKAATAAKAEAAARASAPKHAPSKKVVAGPNRTSNAIASGKAPPPDVCSPMGRSSGGGGGRDLTGNFVTSKGRIISGEELAADLNRMSAAYKDKLEATAGGPPSGVSPGKVLPAEEVEAVVNRLYTSKPEHGDANDKLVHVHLKFDDNGKEIWEPVKEANPTEQREYMCELYQRCIESKKKTEAQLAAKYLQPMGQPRWTANKK